MGLDLFNLFQLWNLRSTESSAASRASSGAGLVQEEPIGGLQPSPGRASLIRWWELLSLFSIRIFVYFVPDPFIASLGSTSC